MSNINNKNIMNLVVSIDDNYVGHLTDLLMTLHDNNESKFNIYLIHDDSLSKDSINKLKEICTTNKYGTLIDVNCTFDYDKFPINVNYITPVTYFRLFIPYLLKDVDRFLYLDCDIICNGPIRKLYDIDLEDNIIGACKNISRDPEWFQENVSVLKLKKNPNYINAGVLLVDAKKYREFITEEEIYNFLANNYDVLRFQDQDAINVLFDEKTRIIDIEYNYQVNCIPEDYIVSNPIIVHYSEWFKPWNLDYNYFYRGRFYYNMLYKYDRKEELKELLNTQMGEYAFACYEFIKRDNK